MYSSINPEIFKNKVGGNGWEHLENLMSEQFDLYEGKHVENTPSSTKEKLKIVTKVDKEYGFIVLSN